MKKILSIMLALFMLALPTLSLAASPAGLLGEAVEAGRPWRAEVSMQAGEIPADADTAALLSDIIDALGFRMDVQQGDAPQTDVALLLSGKEVLTFAVAEKGDDTYIKTNLTGEDVMAFNAEEAQALLERVLKLMVDSGAMTEAELEEIKAQLGSMAGAGNITAMMEGMQVDTAAILSLVAEITAQVTTEEVTAQPRNCDPAVRKVSFTVTRDMLMKYYSLCVDMLKKNEAYMALLNEQMALVADSGEAVTAEEALDKGLETIQNSITAFSAPVSVYLNEKDEPVYALVDATMTTGQEDDQVNLTMTIGYARLTGTEGVSHSATLIANDEEKDGIAMTFNYLAGEKRSMISFDAAEIDEGVSEAPVMSVEAELLKDRVETAAHDQLTVTMTLRDDDESQSMTLKADVSAEKSGEDAAFNLIGKLFLPGSEKEMITLNAAVTTGEAAPSIAVEDAVRPGAMTDDEFNAFLGQVVQSAQTALLVMLQSLPDSVLQLFLQ